MNSRARLKSSAVRVLVVVLATASAACDAPPLTSSPRKPSPTAPASVAAAKPDLLRGAAPVAPFVARAMHETERRILVYVGASWCEPCRHFHEALLRGELDEVLRGVRVLEYDLDQHRDALREAGYSSKYIPLFALPSPDGTASAQAISGSIKGDRAVPDDLGPRLRRLLGSP